MSSCSHSLPTNTWHKAHDTESRMWRWCSLHASIVRKTTKYTASCSTSKKTGITCLSDHMHFSDHSSQQPTNNFTAHARCSHLPRPYHTLWHDIAWHRLYGISQCYGDRPVPLHTALNLVKRKNLTAMWHCSQLDCTVIISKCDR